MDFAELYFGKKCAKWWVTRLDTAHVDAQDAINKN